MGKQYVIYEKDGVNAAHTENYQPKDGEKEVGRVEADSVEQAEKKFKRNGADQSQDDDEQDESLTEEEQKNEADEQARREEEEKEEYEVMQDAKGNVYVAGGESDPANAKQKAAKAPEPVEDPEPGSLGVYRAKSEEDAIKMAKGEFPNPAQGGSRDAQTP
jgi:hypothetical protein